MFGTKILEEKESKYNGHLKVSRSLGFGTYIQADGLTQSGGIVETIWKSTLKQINKLINQPINSCLILGLGGGTAAKLIRKNWPGAKIVGIDIDPIMVELGKKYLGLAEYGVKIIIADAYNLPNLPNFPNRKFDLITVDLYQGDKFPEKFENINFINCARTVLAQDGVVVFNRLYYGNKRPQTVKFGNKLQKVFSNVEWFYPEANLMFVCHL
jgi:spermidine synthase